MTVATPAVPWRSAPEERTAALAAAVRRRRESLGLRQEDLADLAGCSERFVHTVEAGKTTVRFDKLLDLLAILGLTLVVDYGAGVVRVDDVLAASLDQRPGDSR